MMVAWFYAFIFTQLVEVPIYSVGLPCRPLIAFGASAITHPVVWFVIFNPAFEASYVTRIVVAEIFAWGAEAAYFAIILRKRRVILWSFIANASSFGAGLLSRWLFGIP
jgi:hypothetical protein